MATVKEKAALRPKARPHQLDGPLWWCKEHRVWSNFLVERSGRNGNNALELMTAMKRKPYEGFIATAIWDALPLESWSRPSEEAGHWFPTQERDDVLLGFEPGDHIYRCGHSSCGRWWPDQASAEACYDEH